MDTAWTKHPVVWKAVSKHLFLNKQLGYFSMAVIHCSCVFQGNLLGAVFTIRGVYPQGRELMLNFLQMVMMRRITLISSSSPQTSPNIINSQVPADPNPKTLHKLPKHPLKTHFDLIFISALSNHTSLPAKNTICQHACTLNTNHLVFI